MQCTLLASDEEMGSDEEMAEMELGSDEEMNHLACTRIQSKLATKRSKNSVTQCSHQIVPA